MPVGYMCMLQFLYITSLTAQHFATSHCKCIHVRTPYNRMSPWKWDTSEESTYIACAFTAQALSCTENACNKNSDRELFLRRKKAMWQAISRYWRGTCVVWNFWTASATSYVSVSWILPASNWWRPLSTLQRTGGSQFDGLESWMVVLTK